VDKFELSREREITFGRDPECHVRYREADELVSRKHLKIVATDDRPVRFMVVDLGSRNGTFLNRQRVFGAMLILPGGRVQLGADGPEFEFQLETREVEGARHSAGTHRSSSKILGPRRARKRRFLRWAITLFLLAAAGAAGGYTAWNELEPFWRDWRKAQARREVTARFAPSTALTSVGGVEAKWNVFEKQTGARLARAYIPNLRSRQAPRIPLVEAPLTSLPVFVLGADRRIEPLLVPAETAHAGPAVGGKWRSKGVIVSERGAVLTAAPTPYPWKTAIDWTAEEPAGVLLVLESLKITQVVPLAAAQFPRWAPAEPGFFAEHLPPDLEGDVRGRRVSGSDLRVEVTVGITASGQTMTAKLAAESSGLWLAVAQRSFSLPGVRVSQLDDAATHSKNGQRVWVVSDQIAAGKIRDARADGLLQVEASRYSEEGGVVFDHDGRVLALCIPGARSTTGAGLAVPVHRGLSLSGGAPDGKDWQP
jgi:pSer/pThr/pTyr-binding forkhead associated (FHA) protein